MKRTLFLTCFWVLGALFFPRCDRAKEEQKAAENNADEDTESEDEVTIRWFIAGIPSCMIPSLPPPYSSEAVEFDQLLIRVFEDGSETPETSTSVACTDLEYVVTDLDPGSYNVEVDAMATLEGETHPFFIGEAEFTIPARSPCEVSLRLNGEYFE